MSRTPSVCARSSAYATLSARRGLIKGSREWKFFKRLFICKLIIIDSEFPNPSPPLPSLIETHLSPSPASVSLFHPSQETKPTFYSSKPTKGNLLRSTDERALKWRSRWHLTFRSGPVQTRLVRLQSTANSCCHSQNPSRPIYSVVSLVKEPERSCCRQREQNHPSHQDPFCLNVEKFKIT